MNHFLNGLVRAASQSFDMPGPVLELGSYLVEGQEGLGNLRPYFPGRKFIGLDFRAGPGVDLVANAQSLPFDDESVGSLLALSTLEHVAKFWEAAAEITRVLSPTGVALVTAPFYFHIHSYPHDYWRFAPQAFELLFESFPRKIIGWQGDDKRPLNVWAIVFGRGIDALSRDSIEGFAQILSCQPVEPLGFGRRVLYEFLAPILGRRLFSPWLDRHRWTARFQGVLGQPSQCVIRSESPRFIQSLHPE